MIAIIKHLRELGFEDSSIGLHDATLPKGTWKRGDKFIVQHQA